MEELIMKNLTVIEHNKERVLTTKQLEEVGFGSAQQIKQNFNNNKSRFEEGKHYFKLTGKELKEFKSKYSELLGISPMTRTLFLWTKEGVLNMFSILRSSNKLPIVVKEYFDISEELKVFKSCAKEIEFLDILETQLKAIGICNFERQYQVLHYRLDLYIHELNIAIEYDENEHKHYNYEQHELRQKQIEKELGCKFIRVADNLDNLSNSAIVISQLALYIKENQVTMEEQLTKLGYLD